MNHRQSLFVFGGIAVIAMWLSIGKSVAIPPDTQLKKDSAEQYQELLLLFEGENSAVRNLSLECSDTDNIS